MLILRQASACASLGCQWQWAVTKQTSLCPVYAWYECMSHAEPSHLSPLRMVALNPTHPASTTELLPKAMGLMKCLMEKRLLTLLRRCLAAETMRCATDSPTLPAVKLRSVIVSQLGLWVRSKGGRGCWAKGCTCSLTQPPPLGKKPLRTSCEAAQFRRWKTWCWLVALMPGRATGLRLECRATGSRQTSVFGFFLFCNNCSSGRRCTRLWLTADLHCALLHEALLISKS